MAISLDGRHRNELRMQYVKSFDAVLCRECASMAME